MKIYNKSTEEIKAIVEEVFKDYKDPTENMTEEQAKLFHEALKKEVTKWK